MVSYGLTYTYSVSVFVFCAWQECKCVPVAFEPLSCHKAAVLTVIVRMPTGDDEFSPPDQCGIAIGSALVNLGLFVISFCANAL